MKFFMIYPNSTGNTKVPLGIIYLLTLLENAGHEVKLFDMTFYGVELEKHDINVRGKYLNFKPVDLTPYGVTYKHSPMADVESDLARDISDFKPDLIGVSVTEDTALMGFRLANVAKFTAPGVPVIFGGVFCLSGPEIVLSQPCADMLCFGDGESLILNLASRLNYGCYNLIPGLWLKYSDGSIIKNGIAESANMDDLPYMDLSLIDQRHFFNPMAGHVYKMTFVQSERGCPRRCSYCCNQLFLNTYKKYGCNYLRRQSIERFVDEMADIKKKYKVNFFQMTDEDFLFRSLDEIKTFSRLYKRDVDLPFWVQVEANHVTRENIAALKDAGVLSVSMGIETGSDIIREKVYKRHTTKAKIQIGFDVFDFGR